MHMQEKSVNDCTVLIIDVLLCKCLIFHRQMDIHCPSKHFYHWSHCGNYRNSGLTKSGKLSASEELFQYFGMTLRRGGGGGLTFEANFNLYRGVNSPTPWCTLCMTLQNVSSFCPLVLVATAVWLCVLMTLLTVNYGFWMVLELAGCCTITYS